MKTIKGSKYELQQQFTSRFLMNETDMDSLRSMLSQYPNVTKWSMWNIYKDKTPLMSFDVKEKTLYTSLNVTELNEILANALRLENQ